jgi:hypothetical protein
MGYPAFGTFSISILPWAPINNMSILLSSCLSAFAIEMAGKICPPLPPPLIIIFLALSSIIFLFF